MNELTQEQLLEYVKVKAYQLQSVMREVPQELVQHIFQRYQSMAKMTSEQIILDGEHLTKVIPEPEVEVEVSTSTEPQIEDPVKN